MMEARFEMSTVIGRYKDYLNEQQMSLNSYKTQTLKLRLNNHFGDKIVFHQPYDRSKSELLYSTAVVYRVVSVYAKSVMLKDRDFKKKCWKIGRVQTFYAPNQSC